MSHSVRLRFVDWCKRVINDRRQNVAKVLSEENAHPQPARDVHVRGPGVGAQGAERYVDDIRQVPSLSNDVYEKRLATVVANGNLVVSQPDRLSRSYNHFLSHQPSPLGKNHRSLTANAPGVEAT